MTQPSLVRRRSAELPVQSFEWPQGPELAWALEQEWLATNGIGGYASCTVAGCNTRRYHALLVANLSGRGRTVVLPRLVEQVMVNDEPYRLDAEEHADMTLHAGSVRHLRAFRLNGLIPEWEYQLGPVRLLRRVFLVHGENTVLVWYVHLGGPGVDVRLRPFPHWRPHDEPLLDRREVPSVWMKGDRLEVHATDDAVPLRFRLHYAQCQSPFVGIAERSAKLEYRVERSRGYEHSEHLSSPGYFECQLLPSQSLVLCATTDGWESANRDPVAALKMERLREDRILDHAPPRARRGRLARLVLAADQYLVEPVARARDLAWARATGQVARTVTAGYHWFTDWGRDTMIALEGLTLATGRHHEAAAILRTFEQYVRDGLIPNHFPEGKGDGVYHTADATLWYFHAVDRHVTRAGDDELLWDLLPTLEQIVERHVQGTRYGIRVDPADGLLIQGTADLPLTWMDAWMRGWIVTPRRGKAVELNALWFNALCLVADWFDEFGLEGQRYRALAETAQRSFNARFWNEETGCLYDVVDGDGDGGGAGSGGNDPSIRPNQLISFSLRFPILEAARWRPVLETVERELLTPYGLRTLSPRDPVYRPRYDGDLRARDGAYHQGTVWPWLLGHYLDAWLRVHGPDRAARRIFEGIMGCLQAGQAVGQISEIFDAEPPFKPRGCIAQAWSVAEVLRGVLRLDEAGVPE